MKNGKFGCFLFSALPQKGPFAPPAHTHTHIGIRYFDWWQLSEAMQETSADNAHFYNHVAVYVFFPFLFLLKNSIG